ncbi:MAG: RHS repeat protein, partial [Phycisphaerae bacterium]|nr:RHS repeat protein [Phycisphaerae bacterium]
MDGGVGGAGADSACLSPGMSFKVHLGQRNDGRDAGRLEVSARLPSVDLAMRGLLRYSKGKAPAGVHLIRDSVGLRQVKTAQVLVDVVTISDYEYELRFYDEAHWGTESEGLWEPDEGNESAVWVIENPDEASAFNRLQVSKVVAQTCTRRHEYDYDQSSKAWTLASGDCSGSAFRTVTRTSVFDEQAGTRTDTVLSYEGSDLVGQSVQIWQDFGWGYVLIEEEAGTGDHKVVVTRDWHTSVNETGKYKELKSWSNPDGSWGMYDYDAQGRIVLRLSSWKDVAMPETIDEDVGHATISSYSPVSGQSDDDGSLYPDRPRTITEKIEGAAVTKTFYVYYLNTSTNRIIEIEERCAAPNSGYEGTGSLRTTREYVPPGTGGDPSRRLEKVVYPDGRLDVYAYAEGVYTEHQGNPLLPGGFDGNTPGDDLQVTITREGPSGPVMNKSLGEVIIQNVVGSQLLQTTTVYDGSAWQDMTWIVQRFDPLGRRTDAHHNSRSHTQNGWSDCCGLDHEIDEHGIRTEYTYDELGRLLTKTKKGVSAEGGCAAQGDIVTTYNYTATVSGAKVEETVHDPGNNYTLTTSMQYDLANRLIGEVDAAGLSTSYTHEFVTVGDHQAQRLTVTRPGEAKEIRNHYIDGQSASITGTAVIHKYFDRGVANGQRWSTTYTGADLGSSPMWEKTTVDALNQAVQVDQPGYNGSTVTTTNVYSFDRLVKTSKTGQPDTLYEYDDLGQVFQTGEDVDAGGTLVLNSDDRIRETETLYVEDSNVWWRQTISRVYAVSNDDSPTTTAETWEQLTGLPTGTARLTREQDIHLNVTETTVTVDRSAKLVTETIDHPDSTIDGSTVTRNGLLQASVSPTGLTTVYGYDDLGRQTTVADSRVNTTETAYYASGTGAEGKVQSVVDASGNRTCYKYDAVTGRQTEVITGANGSCEGGQSQYFAYSDRGELARTWGDSPYPVEYGYDDYGRRVSMKTFRGGSGWDGAAWPANPGTADETEWVFEEATGLLLSKEYADSTHVDYTYTPAGKLATRTWARLDGENALTTTYTYAGNTGDLTDIEYSDSTQDVEFTYDRLGRQETITDAVGTRTFGYHATKLHLVTEDIDAGQEGLYSKVVTRRYELYDQEGGVIPGRNRGFKIGNDYEVTYHYDSLGRLERVTGPGLPAYGVQYTRLMESSNPTSDMVESLAYKSDGSTTLASTTRGYQEDRDLLASVQNVVQGTPNVTVSNYAYQLDSLGRRTSVLQTGTAFGQDHLWKWSYNDRSELTGADRHEGTELEEPLLGDRMTPGEYTYNYDPIGNRLLHRVDNDASRRWYCANNVNQHTAIDDEASTCPTPSTPTEELAYDADGNLVSDGTRVYSWDAENRLVAVAPAVPAAGDKKVVFTYDYMSRRVQKRVFAWNATLNGGAGDWEANPEVYQRFVYD